MGNTMKRLAIGCASFALVGLVVITFLILAQCRRGVISECNYGKIRLGMTVSEAEAILGSGRELEGEYVPRTHTGPVISGDRFFKWEDGTTARAVWVGIRSGRVCDKWYWEPSL
jgi:hypothetical protein